MPSLLDLLRNFWEDIAEEISEFFVMSTAKNFNSAFEMLGVEGAVGQMLTTHPEEFSGITAYGQEIELAIGEQSVFQYFLEIGHSVIFPIGVTILVFLAIYELATMLSNGNFREFEIGIFARWSIKFVISLVIMANAFHIVNMLFSLGPILFEFFGNFTIETEYATLDDGLVESLSELTIGDAILAWIMSGVTYILMFISQLFVLHFLIIRMIEVAIMASLAPIPLATFANSEYKKTGESYIKIILTYGVQALLIIVIISAFTGILANVANNIADAGSVEIPGSFLPLLIMQVAMLSLIKNSKSFAEKVIN